MFPFFGKKILNGLMEYLLMKHFYKSIFFFLIILVPNLYTKSNYPHLSRDKINVENIVNNLALLTD